MLLLRFFLGALALGLAFGAVQCAIDAQTASATVRATLEQVFIIACTASLLFATVAVCVDHRTARERRTAQRHKERMQRARNRIDRAALERRYRAR
jgi:hypothetical protein